MENSTYPSLPYSIRLQTKTAIVWMIWQDTPWDTPAPVTYDSDFEPAVSVVKDLFTTAIGFQGYAIEDVDRPSPMDIHAALVSPRRDPFITGFDLIGMIPEPPSAPDEDIEPDEDEDDEEASDEPPVEPVLESIPPGTKVKLPFILEDTGETVHVETDAREALNESETETALFESIIKRMES